MINCAKDQLKIHQGKWVDVIGFGSGYGNGYGYGYGNGRTLNSGLETRDD